MASKDALTWSALTGADGYDAVVGDLDGLRAGGIAGSLRGCLERNGADTTAIDPEVPPAGVGRYYLVRARSCSAALGSYADGGPAQVEPRDAAADASSNDCP
jgi:hypothetical protein